MTGLNWFASVFTVTVLSADRYAAVCHAVSSTSYRTPTLAASVSAGVWLLSLAVVTPVYLYADTVCPSNLQWWCIKLWVIASLGCVQVVGFFDFSARVRSHDGPIAALLGRLVLAEATLYRFSNVTKSSIEKGKIHAV